MSEIARMQDALCAISDAAFGGELAWTDELLGMEEFTRIIVSRLKDCPATAEASDEHML